jgi:hypothetical protein
LLHLGHILIVVIYSPSQSISDPHLWQTIGRGSLVWNIINVPQSGLPQRYVRLPKELSNPLTMDSNTLTIGLSVSADGLLMALYRLTDVSLISEADFAEVGFVLSLSIYYFTATMF